MSKYKIQKTYAKFGGMEPFPTILAENTRFYQAPNFDQVNSYDEHPLYYVFATCDRNAKEPHDVGASAKQVALTQSEYVYLVNKLVKYGYDGIEEMYEYFCKVKGDWT